MDIPVLNVEASRDSIATAHTSESAATCAQVVTGRAKSKIVLVDSTLHNLLGTNVMHKQIQAFVNDVFSGELKN